MLEAGKAVEGGAGEDGVLGLFEGFGEIFREASADEGGGGIEQDDVAFRAVEFAAKNFEEDFGVGGGVAALEIGELGGGESELERIELEGGGLLSFSRGEFGDFVDAHGGELVGEAIFGCVAADDPSIFASELVKNLGVERDEAGLEDAGELEAWAGGVEERADDVENGFDAALGEELARGGNGFEARVVVGSEEEAYASVLDAVAEALRGHGDVDAECLENVGAAAFGGEATVAMFDDGGTAGGGDEHGGGGDVEKSELVTAGADDVERVSGGGDFGVDGAREKFADEAGDFLGGGAFFGEQGEGVSFLFVVGGGVEEPIGHFSRLLGGEMVVIF